MKHVQSFDGVRGLAIALVLVFHPGYLPFGWVGIQLFFVLSGCLITTILLEDKQSTMGEYLGRFYWRRFLRIFPLFFGFLFIAGLAYRFTGTPESFANDWPYLFTYTANFARARASDIGEYFVHIWSLSVEEQFYLIWPLLIFLLDRKTLKKALLAIILLAPLVRHAVYVNLDGGLDPAHQILSGRLIYGMTFTQLDAFAVGAAIPIFGLEKMKHAGRWFAASVGLLGLGGLVMLAVYALAGLGVNPGGLGYPMFMIRFHQYTWGYSLLNIVSALLLICGMQRIDIVRPVLEFRPLAYLGKISYGVYIFHLPVMVLAKQYFAQGQLGTYHPLFVLAYLGGTVAIAAVSYRYFETPFLRLKNRFFESRRQLRRTPSMVGEPAFQDGRAA